MLTLYHFPLCPKSRFIRVLLKEFDISFQLETIEYWLRPQKLIQLNPAGELPVITDPTHHIICGFYPTIEYLLELEPNIHLNCSTIENRTEMRRLIDWVMNKFFNEVISYILEEKMLRLFTHTGSPRTEYIRAAKINCNYHIQYLTNLINARGYLASDQLTLADLALASQISVLDYFGEIHWDQFERLKSWYAPIKSRPSFRPLLSDHITVISPTPHYANLDF